MPLRALLLASLLACGSSAARPPTSPAPSAPEADPAAAPAAPPSEPGPLMMLGSDPKLNEADRALAQELARLMTDVRAQLERVLAVLEGSDGDCEKVATALQGPEFDSSKLNASMAALREKVSQHGPMNAELRRVLREITEATFPPELRQRMDAVDLDARCASNANYQRALRSSGYAKAPPP
ncbi:MAG: hypothetical protein R3B48_01115 [Kofleriaceae bacterium]